MPNAWTSVHGGHFIPSIASQPPPGTTRHPKSELQQAWRSPSPRPPVHLQHTRPSRDAMRAANTRNAKSVLSCSRVRNCGASLSSAPILELLVCRSRLTISSRATTEPTASAAATALCRTEHDSTLWRRIDRRHNAARMAPFTHSNDKRPNTLAVSPNLCSREQG